MKKFNLLQEIVVVEKEKLIQAIDSKKNFAITINGEITYDQEGKILLFALKNKTVSSIEELFGNEYKTAQSQTQVAIKGSMAFKEIVQLNYLLATYDDSTNDGISEFDDTKLEEIGWWADEFDIDYRELVDVLESKAEGVVLCVEQEEPYHFSGLGFVSDTQGGYSILFEYVQNKISDKLQNNPEYAKNNLTKEQLQALKYFKL